MAKYSAYGMIIARGAVTVAQVRSISGPGLSVDTVDVTSHDSLEAWEEVVPTILRSGEVTLEIIYDPAEATHKNSSGGLLADLVGRAAVTYNLKFPDLATTTWSFSAFVTGFEPSGVVDGELMANVTLKLTGKPTLV